MRDDQVSILSDEPRNTWPVPAKVVLVLSLWLLFGFAIGTLTLLYPVRWWATLCRESGWSQLSENAGVVILMLLLVGVSFSLALGAATKFIRTENPFTRIFLLVFSLGAAGFAYVCWTHPEMMKKSMSAEQQAGARFTFGPFPDKKRLSGLKDEGYTGVISLLHPAVVPFEPQLIEREKKDAAEAGIELIHLPMLPWISENTDSLNKLYDLAEKKTGRYYIHCYLGTDRVNVARRIIEQATAGQDVVIEGSGALSRRNLATKKRFERGKIHVMEEGLYLIPYPTDEEWVGFILAGQVKNVMALLDPSDEGDKRKIDSERAKLESYRMPFHLVEVGTDHFDAGKVLEAVQKAKTLEKPTVIHTFFTPPDRSAPISRAILIANRSGLPPLVAGMFERSLSGGPATVIAPNVATGPFPSTKDLQKLRERGVRSLLFVGGSSGGEAAAAAAGLDLRVVKAADVERITSSGGPYYLYGPGSSKAAKILGEKYATMMPGIDGGS